MQYKNIPQRAFGTPKEREYFVVATPSQSIKLETEQKEGTKASWKFVLKWMYAKSEHKPIPINTRINTKKNRPRENLTLELCSSIFTPLQ